MASVAVLGAAGYAGAIAAQLLYQHPFFELGARDRAGGGGAAARRRAPAHARAAGARGLRRRQAAVDAAVVAYPHGAAAPVVAELRDRGVRVVDLSRRLPAARPRHLRGLVRRAQGARATSGRASTGCRSSRAREVAGADLVANPGCYPTAALLGLAPLARAGLIGDVVIDGKSGVSGAGRGATHATHFISRRRERLALQDRGPPPHAGDRAGARRARQRRDDHVHAAPAAARAGRARLLLRHAVARARRRASSPSSSTTPTRASRSSSCATGRSACSTCATPTTAGSRGIADPRNGPVIVFAAIDNLWKGAASQAVQNLNLMFGRPETEGLR